MARKYHDDSNHERNDIFHQVFRGNFSILLKCQQLDNPPLFCCVMSLIPPQPIESLRPLPASRQRWWQNS